MDFQGSQLLGTKNLSKTWSFILTLVTLMWLVGQKNLVVRASVIESGHIGVLLRQGAFEGDSVSDHSNGLRGENQGDSDQNGRPGQHGGRDRWATTSQRTQGKSTFTIKESANRDEDIAKTWLEGRLSHSEHNRVNDRGNDKETVSNVGKRPWFQSWSGKRRRDPSPGVTINKGAAERGLASKEVPDDEDGVAKFKSENIKGPTKMLSILPQRDSISTQQLNRESWSLGRDPAQGRLQRDGKISRETSDETRENLARYQQHVSKNYDYLNSLRGREADIGGSKYFPQIPYLYNVPNVQTAQDKNIPDQENFFSNLDYNSQFNVNKKKSAQRKTYESDRSSSHHGRMSHKVTQPASYLPDSDNLALRMSTFDDLKFMNSTTREWIARDNGREVLLHAFKSLYHQMSNVPGAQIKSNEKKTLRKNVDSEYRGRRFQSKAPKPSSYSTHRKRPAFHSWGGKKRNTGNSGWSSNVPGLDQNFPPKTTRFVLKELPKRNERSILSFKIKRSQGRANPEDSVANLESDQTHHGNQFENLGSDRTRNNLNNGESDSPTTLSGSSPAQPKLHRNALKNNNSEPITGGDDNPDGNVSGGDEKLDHMSTANDPIGNRRQSNSFKLFQTDGRGAVKTGPTQVKTNFDHVRATRSDPKNNKISQRLPATHKLEEQRSPSDVSLIKRAKREATHADVSPANLRDVNFMSELKQNGGGDAVPGDVARFDTDETSSQNEPTFPMFGMYPYTKLKETVGQTGQKVVDQPSLYTWWEKSDILGDMEKRPSFHSWSGKRNVIGEPEKRPSFHSWSGKRDSVGELEKRTSFHSWSGKHDVIGELEKRPSFHSWSGKRDSAGELEKRPSFHSWSGKRDSVKQLEKRPSFHSWSGKRDNVGEIEKRPSFHSWSGKRDNAGEFEKRPSFHSWSGKREVIGELDKRTSFHSWSGKRDSARELEKRPSFHSWSGKRNSFGELEKRPSFHSWSGKRDSAGELEKRPSFHSWSGKRDSFEELEKRPSFHSWSGKRDSSGELEKRPSFHSWSGKRDSSGELEKRPSFRSWSGKRATSDDLETDASSESVAGNQLSNAWQQLPRMSETDPLISGDTSIPDTSLGNDDSDYFLKFSSLNVFPGKWDSSQDEQET